MTQGDVRSIRYLQVSGDGVVGSVGDHEDAVGLADHLVAHLQLPCMPVGDPCPHDGHPQQGVVGVVQLPVQKDGSKSKTELREAESL